MLLKREIACLRNKLYQIHCPNIDKVSSVFYNHSMQNNLSEKEKEQIFREYKTKAETIKKRMYQILLEVSRKIDDAAYRKTLEKLEG